MTKKFEVIDGETLVETYIAPTEFIVENLIAPGLHILSGAPKIGKSWMAFWLCLQVAKGELVWNFKTSQGTTLYLALEDSLERVQDRLTYMTYDAPPSLYVTLLSESIVTGLEEQIRNFVKEHPNTKLIMIDTFQKIRSISNDNAYAVDYKDVGYIKKIADELKIAIVLIHHVRKESHDDPISMVSGTNGITGAADSVFVLKKSKRSSVNATMCCTGRDIPYRELELNFNEETKLWKLISDSVENPEILLENIVGIVVEFMKENETFSGTPTELAELLSGYCKEKIEPITLSKRINKNQPDIEDAGIYYKSKRSNGKRIIILQRAERSKKSADSDGNPYIPITVPADPVGESE